MEVCNIQFFKIFEVNPRPHIPPIFHIQIEFLLDTNSKYFFQQQPPTFTFKKTKLPYRRGNELYPKVEQPLKGVPLNTKCLVDMNVELTRFISTPTRDLPN